MWRTLEQSVYAAVFALLLIFLGNFLTGGWILRLLGGLLLATWRQLKSGSFNLTMKRLLNGRQLDTNK